MECWGSRGLPATWGIPRLRQCACRVRQRPPSIGPHRVQGSNANHKVLLDRALPLPMLPCTNLVVHRQQPAPRACVVRIGSANQIDRFDHDVDDGGAVSPQPARHLFSQRLWHLAKRHLPDLEFVFGHAGIEPLALDCLRANGPQKGALSPSTRRPRGKGEELPPARAVWSMIDHHLR